MAQQIRAEEIVQDDFLWKLSLVPQQTHFRYSLFDEWVLRGKRSKRFSVMETIQRIPRVVWPTISVTRDALPKRLSGWTVVSRLIGVWMKRLGFLPRFTGKIGILSRRLTLFNTWLRLRRCLKRPFDTYDFTVFVGITRQWLTHW